MKNFFILLFIIFSASFLNAQVSWQGGSNPEQNASATILFNKTGTGLASYNGIIYAHIGVTLNGNPWQNVIGTWGVNTSQPALTLVSGSTYKLDLTPTIQSFFNVSSGSITKINVVFRNATGNSQTVDLELNVGAFQSTLVNPLENSTTILNSGQSINISANNTNGNANYNLIANGVSIHTSTGSTYSFTDTNITSNRSYILEINQGAVTFSRKFNVIINPGTISQALPAGLEDGINYNSSDPTKATLVLTAPGKDFVYVAGSFNNWQPNTSFAMRKDPTTGKFWLELSGLTSGVDYTYQYWVVDTTPFANSPAFVKTADPYSHVVLSPFDDPWIPSSSFPNLPPYPAGQEREVTWLKTGQTPYNWSNATLNFIKPNKDNLVIYEVLVRDFDANRNYQDLINKIDYFKNLGVNAIQLMPVMEFEGNESWGYNTSFHLALDKFYGTENKFKEFIDLCHQNGIAVILDVALNHAFGRNPMVRMWMKDPDGDGWGEPSAENPYFNEFARHSYSVGSDFNHSSELTRYYTRRVVKRWIQDFKIDGFRWDLTKGFTQNCTGGDDTCTNNYQADRVQVLRDYADYSWSLDNNHYVIFEHLGSDNEEQQWANYKINEGKGIMMWGEMWSQYGELMKGTSGNKDISRMSHFSRGFTGKRLIGYPESHDKDRMVYEGVTFGNGSGAFPVGGNLNNAIRRMSALGAVSILVPGPKMIWHFASLGMDDSIWMCTNGTVNSDYDNGNPAGDCKLDTKPQPQWTENWLTDPIRSTVYNNWSKFINLKKNNSVFNADFAISAPGGNNNNVRQRIYLWNGTGPLTNVVILANFSVANLDIVADFPFAGTWFNLMDNTTLNVTNTAMNINIESGGFRIFGNALPLSEENFTQNQNFKVYPNPTKDSFFVSETINQLEIYSITGQLVKKYDTVSSNDLISIADLNNGIYLLKIIDANYNQITRKLVKE